MLKLKVTITGRTYNDLRSELVKIRKRIEEGFEESFAVGHTYKINGEEERERDDDSK